jgi:hypothetical protein
MGEHFVQPWRKTCGKRGGESVSAWKVPPPAIDPFRVETSMPLVPGSWAAVAIIEPWPTATP